MLLLVQEEWGNDWTRLNSGMSELGNARVGNDRAHQTRVSSDASFVQMRVSFRCDPWRAWHHAASLAQTGWHKISVGSKSGIFFTRSRFFPAWFWSWPASAGSGAQEEAGAPQHAKPCQGAPDDWLRDDWLRMFGRRMNGRRPAWLSGLCLVLSARRKSGQSKHCPDLRLQSIVSQSVSLHICLFGWRKCQKNS